VVTRDPVTLTPDTSVKSAAQILVDRGFAAAPVVDGEDRLVGIVSEADDLRDRVPPDPRVRLRRDADDGSAAPPVHLRGVMTTDVRTADADADGADVARLLVDERVRSVPVVDLGRLVGVVSRRDLLRTVARPDEQLRGELLRLIESYDGNLDGWGVTVRDGVATVRRNRALADAEEGVLRVLARTVRGLVGMRVLRSSANGAVPPHRCRSSARNRADDPPVADLFGPSAGRQGRVRRRRPSRGVGAVMSSTSVLHRSQDRSPPGMR
jgi:CBS domain-containing protein